MTKPWTRFLLPGVAGVAAQVPVYARAWDCDNGRINDGAGARWVVLGDSLSQGIGASSYRSGWVGQVDRRLKVLGRDYAILNLSKAGATSSDVRERQLGELDRLRRAPDLVTLLVGSNDMLRRSARSVLLANYRAILQRLPPQSVVAYLPQPVPLAHRVNREIDEMAQAVGFRTVNVRPAVRPFRGHRAGDLFHPNDRGHGRLAHVFVRAILQLPVPEWPAVPDEAPES